jgi:1L-myo-inositol 1-phosphate cytidylyltransferase / CDP-L-myo-inositol myo-inositolphosphotransferase
VRKSLAVRRAVILAAGNGDRFHSKTTHSKLLAALAGMPLINRTILTAARAGIRLIDVIVGYQADAVRSTVETGVPTGVDVRFHHNERWHEENGVSALVARAHVDGERFALLMGDHVFDWRVLENLLKTAVEPGESLLAVDRAAVMSERAPEATKVRLAGDRIVAIGKDLAPFDALDTGVFVFSAPIFEALEESRAAGDTSLSGGVRLLAARGLMRGVDTGGSPWCDVDTVDDLREAVRCVDL